MKLPVRTCGEAILDPQGRPVVRTREQTQRLADRMARDATRRDRFTWHGAVCAGPIEHTLEAKPPLYYRINLAAQPSYRTPCST